MVIVFIASSLAACVAVFLLAGIRVIRQYESGVLLRWGKYVGMRSAGLNWIIPGVDQLRIIDMRVAAEQVPPQDVITRDNVSMRVDAVIYFQVNRADLAFLQVKDYRFATSQFAQTTLRSVLGKLDMDDLLSQREKINLELRETIDRNTEPWGIKVTAVEVKQVDLPLEMKRAMAKQAEAERERRAKVIAAQGEFQASQKLSEAADIMHKSPGALQLRYMQTLAEISVEKNSTILFPLPIELMRPFLQKDEYISAPLEPARKDVTGTSPALAEHSNGSPMAH